MANKNHKDIQFHVDNAAGTLTDITSYVNSQELSRAIALQEDTGEGQEERTFLPGLGGNVFTVNGHVNSTTEAIYGPLVGDNTSITKTVAYRTHSGRYHKAETWVGSVRFSGDRESLQTFSAEHTVTGAVNRTSVIGA